MNQGRSGGSSVGILMRSYCIVLSDFNPLYNTMYKMQDISACYHYISI